MKVLGKLPKRMRSYYLEEIMFMLKLSNIYAL
jgi:hypothetical protein